jgi:hypothetical protein
MEITDFNCDCGPYAFTDFPQTTAAEVAAELRRWGIGRMVMGSVPAITYVSPQPANEALARELAALGDAGIISAAVLNPAYPGAERDLRRCADLGFGALKLYPTYHGFDLTSHETVRLADLATERGWPVLVVARIEDERHHHPLMQVPALAIEQAITFARNVSAAQVVLCAGTAPEVTSFLQGVHHDRATAEVSWIKGPLNAIEDLVGHVGHERLLFGSHAPFIYPQVSVAKVAEAFISEEQKAAILHGNAARVLGRS